MFVAIFNCSIGPQRFDKDSDLFFRLLRQFFNPSERGSVAKAEFPLLSIKNNILTFGVRAADFPSLSSAGKCEDSKKRRNFFVN